MKLNTISILIIMAFLGVIFFGFIPADHGGHHASEAPAPCPFSQFLTASCVFDPISMAALHIGALQSFSNVPLASVFLLSALLAAFALYIHRERKREGDEQLTLIPIPIEPSHDRHTSQDEERSWMSLFENSPSSK